MPVLHCHVVIVQSRDWVVILCHVFTCLHCMTPIISVISLCRGRNDWNSTMKFIYHYFPGQDACLTHTDCATFTTTLLCASKTLAWSCYMNVTRNCRGAGCCLGGVACDLICWSSRFVKISAAKIVRVVAVREIYSEYFSRSGRASDGVCCAGMEHAGPFGLLAIGSGSPAIGDPKLAHPNAQGLARFHPARPLRFAPPWRSHAHFESRATKIQQ